MVLSVLDFWSDPCYNLNMRGRVGEYPLHYLEVLWMAVDLSTVLSEVRTHLDQAGGFTISRYSVCDARDWEHWQDNDDGIDSCSHVVRIVTYSDGADLPYDGIDVPVETHVNGIAHIAGWYEIDSPDLQGATLAEADEWVAKHGTMIVV